MSNTTKPQLTVMYSCAACRTVDRPMQVDGREQNEDILEWMEKVQTALGADHAYLGCSSPTCDLKIPSPKDADWIGQAMKQ